MGITWDAIKGVMPGWLKNNLITLKQLLTNPRAVLFGTILTVAFDWFVAPVVEGILLMFGIIVDTILLMAFGSDRALGGEKLYASIPGVADIPFLLIRPVDIAVGLVFGPTVAAIATVNEQLAEATAQLGVAAPIAGAFIVTVELGIVLYLLYLVGMAVMPYVTSGVRQMLAPFAEYLGG